jgi:general bacterial porin, GBP family
MKRTLLLAALAGLFASAAQAQNSVTLYGMLDTSVGYVSNAGGPAGGHGSEVHSGGGMMQDDVVGVAGSVDLGSGWRAIYNVQAESNVGTGALSQRSRNAGGTAYVGVGG